MKGQERTNIFSFFIKMKQKATVVLCSASPRRQQLLREIGLDIEILVKDVNEDFSPDLKAEAVVLFLAGKKADAFQPVYEPGKIYITADTIVWLNGDHPDLPDEQNRENGEVLGKPVNVADAFTILKKLSGKMHQVFTGVCLSSTDKRELFYVRSDVHFRELKDDEILYYIDHYKPFDKAGAYGAQECLPENMNPCSKLEMEFMKSIRKDDLFERTKMKDKKHMPVIDRINGSYFNVMGLPVVEVWEHLEHFAL